MVNLSDHPVFAKDGREAATLSAEELGQIRRLLERIPATSPAPIHIERDLADGDLARLAKRIYNSRRTIEQCFQNEVANDPSIDLLLLLFIQRSRGEMMTVTEACNGTSAPATTALRRLSILTGKGYVVRMPHRHDKRTIFVKLSDEADALVRRWLLAWQTSE